MIRLALYCTLVYLVSAVPTKAPWTRPWFCHDLDCPTYRVLESHSTYEVREYEPSVWISVTLKDVPLAHSVETGLFFELFSYIQGSNVEKKTIAMTAPVVDDIFKKGSGNVDVTRSFMIPTELQANPPTPTDPKVFVNRLPAMKVYVESFPGFDIEGQRPAKIAELKAAINDSSLYDTTRFLSAGYDSPFAFGNRHNEVWLMAV